MKFTKMQGLGNDYVYVNLFEEKVEDPVATAIAVSDRHFGIGSDGLILIGPSDVADFEMIMYTLDGSRGEMCGNGARCLVRYAVEHGLAADEEDVRILADAGLVRGRRLAGELCEIRLNDPSLIEPHRAAEGEDCAYVELGRPGLPHAVVEVPPSAFDDLDALRERGRALRRSAAFPKGANVSFACVTGERSVRAITFERGVEDFTLACGTGCGSIAASLILRGRIPGERAEIDMPGGHLSVRLRRVGESVRELWLTGPTAVVGEYEI